MRFLVKILITAVVVASVSELGKRLPIFAAIIASLPLTSVLALSWLYWDTSDAVEVADLSHQIFFAVFPSLLFFLLFPFLLKKGFSFTFSMVGASSGMVLFYALYAQIIGKFWIQ